VVGRGEQGRQIVGAALVEPAGRPDKVPRNAALVEVDVLPSMRVELGRVGLEERNEPHGRLVPGLGGGEHHRSDKRCPELERGQPLRSGDTGRGL
jgi:hypothetical protein